MASIAEELRANAPEEWSLVAKIFPRLKPECLTSSPDASYNCIAWAVDQKDVWWDPFVMPGHYWPPNIPRGRDLSSFYLAYGTLGYIQIIEGDIDKYQHVVAIMGFGIDSVTHAMKRLPNGRWSSKLGGSFDITHDLHDLDGKKYGHVIGFMGKDNKELALSDTSH